ncbi:hypothetical protein ACHAXT_001147 [Thalassiosira profunda]
MPPRTRRALPAKRAAEEEPAGELSPSTKKSKAELRRQSLSRAQDWAADRKRKAGKDVGSAKKSRPAPTPAKTRRRGTSKVVAAALAASAEDVAVGPVEESVGAGTRRSSRRRTMSTNTTAVAETKPKETKAKATKAPRATRTSRRKTVAPVVPAIKEEVDEPQVSPRSVQDSLPELKAEEEEVPVELEVKEEVVVQEEVAEEPVEEEEDTDVVERFVCSHDISRRLKLKLKSPLMSMPNIRFSAEETKKDKVETEADGGAQDVNDAANQGGIMAYLFQLSPVFFHALTIQWTLAFAVVMAFCYDWWLFEFGPDYEDAASQQATCFTLGLWLVTIAGYAIAFGPGSRAGWILTGSALTMVSFSAKMIAPGVTSVPFLPIHSFNGFEVNVEALLTVLGVDTASLPSLPIYSLNGFGIGVPDLLVFLCLAGCVATLKQTKVSSEQPQEVVEEEVKEEAPKEDAQVAPEATGPRSLIGQRVAMEKEGIEMLGTVKEYVSDTREWLIHYDDEFQVDDEVNRLQLTSGFKNYSKHLSDNVKAMWRAGEL